jgi:hypothetical protein
MIAFEHLWAAKEANPSVKLHGSVRTTKRFCELVKAREVDTSADDELSILSITLDLVEIMPDGVAYELLDQNNRLLYSGMYQDIDTVIKRDPGTPDVPDQTPMI